MNEGQILSDFIDRQKKSKKQIAEDLNMSRSNLYQMFGTQTLTAETKKKFETYFGDTIFNKKHEVVQNPETMYSTNNGQSKIVTEAEVIRRQDAHIADLQAHFAWLQKMYEEMKDKTNANLLSALDNQHLQMRELAVLSKITAEGFAAGDMKKAREILNKVDRLISADRKKG